MRAAEITRRLQLDPQTAWTVGEEAPTTNTAGEMIPRRVTYWTWPVPVKRKDELPDVLEGNMARLRRHSRWLRKFRDTGGRLEYFIFIGLDRRDNFGVTLRRELVDQASSLGIDLALDLYGPHK